MSKIRAVFMGTPDFAVHSLKALIADEHFEVVGVVTQPDRPAGRKLVLTPSPVKVVALSFGLPVVTPDSLRQNPVIVDTIRSWRAEVAVVVAFGQILTEDFIQMFTFGAVNIHGSVLPRWRGAAPIQRAIEAGDQESGVTLQKLVKKLDAGDIIGLRRVPITKTTTAEDLYEQLAFLGADLLRVDLMDYVRGNLIPVPQDESKVSFAKKIDKAEALIDWSNTAFQIDCKIRAFNMGPGTYCYFQGKKLKIRGAREYQGGDLQGCSDAPGTVVKVEPHRIFVSTGCGILEINEVQPESRNVMNIADFLKGHQGFATGISLAMAL